jgi:hypothetical protein
MADTPHEPCTLVQGYCRCAGRKRGKVSAMQTPDPQELDRRATEAVRALVALSAVVAPTEAGRVWALIAQTSDVAERSARR